MRVKGAVRSLCRCIGGLSQSLPAGLISFGGLAFGGLDRNLSYSWKEELAWVGHLQHCYLPLAYWITDVDNLLLINLLC